MKNDLFVTSIKTEKNHFQNNLASYMDIPYFKDLSKKTITSISKVAVFRNYIPKNHIIIEGKSCEGAYLILKGSVNVYRTSFTGRKQVLTRLGPEDWISANCCLRSEEKNFGNAIALTPVRALLFPRNGFLRLLEEHPLLCVKVLDNFSERIRLLVNKIENLSLRSTSGRLALFLINHADENGVIHWHCTQKDIADRLGTVADVISRKMRQFADEGLVNLPVKNCIVITDIEGLKEKTLE